MTSTTTTKTALGADDAPALVPIKDYNAFETLRDAVDAGLYAFCTVFTSEGRGYTVLTDDGVWLLGRRVSDVENSEFITHLPSEKIPTSEDEARELAHRDYDVTIQLENRDPLILLGLKPRTQPHTVYGSQYPPDWR